VTPSPVLRFYTRAGCHLCDEARSTLQSILEERAAAGLPNPQVRTVDIDEEAETLGRYRESIPVLSLGGRELGLATSGRRIRRFLDEALASVLA
jgi:glutaredoxin